MLNAIFLLPSLDAKQWKLLQIVQSYHLSAITPFFLPLPFSYVAVKVVIV